MKNLNFFQRYEKLIRISLLIISILLILLSLIDFTWLKEIGDSYAADGDCEICDIFIGRGIKFVLLSIFSLFLISNLFYKKIIMPSFWKQLRLFLLKYDVWIIIFLMIFFFLVRLYYLDSFPYYEDERGSIDKAKEVLDLGYTNYGRSLLNSYFIAFSLKFFGESLFAERFVSIFFSLMTIPLIYLIGKSINYRLSGMFTAFIINFFYLQTNLSLSARFYAQLQFFMTLTILFFILGFFYNRECFKIFSIFAFVATYFSDHQGAIFIPLLICSLLIIAILIKKFSIFKDKYLWILIMTGIILRIFFPKIFNYFMTKTQLGVYKCLQCFGGTLKLIFSQPFDYLNLLFNISPFLFFFFLLGFLYFIYIYLLNRDKSKLKIIFLFLVFIIHMFVLTFYSAEVLSRYFFALFPIYCLLSIISIGIFLKSFFNLGKFFKSISYKKSRNKFLLLKIIIFVIFVVFLFLFDIYLGLANKNYNLSSQRIDHRPSIFYLIEQIKSDEDIIIATNPGVIKPYIKNKTIYFLRDYGPVNGHLEKGPFNETRPNQIDCVEKLNKLMRNSSRILIHADCKYGYATSNEMKQFIENNFIVIYNDSTDNDIKIYLFENNQI